MADQYAISDEVLGSAGALLAAAARGALQHSSGVPSGGFETLTGVGGDVVAFARGLRTAAGALADAAQTSARELAGIMHESSQIDAQLAHAFARGFAVPRSER